MLHLNVELAALRVLLLLLVTGFGVLADRVSLERSVYGEVLADRVSLERSVYGEVMASGALVSFWALMALVCVLAVAIAYRLAY